MQYASVLLFNAVVLTLDGNDAVASAPRWTATHPCRRRSGRAGSAHRAGPECRTWGCCRAPGFTTPTGIFYDRATRARKPQFAASGTCRTLGDILAAIRARARNAQGEWVLAYGLTIRC
ncbi:MAG: hypothetical protein ACLSAH_17300 [Bilophila wadsworthia]